MRMLLAVRLSAVRAPDAPAPSPVPVLAPVPAPALTVSSSAASHSRPNSYGFANGEPLMLSMLSSFRGQRGGGGYAGVFGIAGLKFEVEGTRTGVGRVTWRAREAAVCLIGDGVARMRGAEGMRATLRGYKLLLLLFWCECSSDSMLQNRKVRGRGRTEPGVLGAWMREGMLVPARGGGFF